MTCGAARRSAGIEPEKRRLYYHCPRLLLLPPAAEASGTFPAQALPIEAGILGRRAYLASVAFVDEQVGRIMCALRETSQLARTLIIFTSDHGDAQVHRTAFSTFHMSCIQHPSILLATSDLLPAISPLLPPAANLLPPAAYTSQGDHYHWRKASAAGLQATISCVDHSPRVPVRTTLVARAHARAFRTSSLHTCR